MGGGVVRSVSFFEGRNYSRTVAGRATCPPPPVSAPSLPLWSACFPLNLNGVRPGRKKIVSFPKVFGKSHLGQLNVVFHEFVKIMQ